MFGNYLSIALRLIRKQPGYAFINIVCLAVGMAAFFVITLFVSDELSYDRHHENSDRIYRIALDGVMRTGDIHTATTSPNWGPNLEAEIPEIEHLVRLKPPNQMWLVEPIRWIIRAIPSAAFVINESAVREFGWESPGAAIGRRISFAGGDFSGEVIGVMQDFHF